MIKREKKTKRCGWMPYFELLYGKPQINYNARDGGLQNKRPIERTKNTMLLIRMQLEYAYR